MTAFKNFLLFTAAAALFTTAHCGKLKPNNNTPSSDPSTNSTSTDFSAESVPIIFDSNNIRQHNSTTLEHGGILLPEPIESSVLQAVQHQTEKIYEGIVKLFVQLVGGPAALEPQPPQDPLLERSRSTASRHAATCFNAIDIVGPNHDGLRDAIVDFHNGLRVERCMSPFNLALTDGTERLNTRNYQPTLLHWDDVLVKVADKILDIGAKHACEGHHSSDINALAAKKFAHFGVNTWQSHKTCNWADVLNEWSAPAMMNSNSAVLAAGLTAALTNAGEQKPTGEKKNSLKTHANGEESKINTASGRFYRQMLWKGATGIGCAATLVACGEFDHTVKLYACAYNNRIPEHARDTDEVMCGESDATAMSPAQQAIEPQQQQPPSGTFERYKEAPIAESGKSANNSTEFAAANQESGTLPDKPQQNSISSSEFGALMDSRNFKNTHEQLSLLILNR